ncbi:uncharacterized protein LOC132698729 [Cylas formicarius]|uniref:uncharacterized protein LOC132698729 n=1 Tax=Cylas formicarius TaxID=197179 RepID=UPI002958349D|nr:uncharacterized protein LOC132698729 [Cylas formicarius]
MKREVILYGVLLIAALLQIALAAPKPTNVELLERGIAEYLKQDKELIKELGQIGLVGPYRQGTVFERLKRQAEFDINEQDFEEGDQQKPGFFDRAAKFVVDLLQRFLKWINTDGN